MKKLITILTIMMVLVGTVFAASTTKNDELKVSVEITAVAPVYKLYGSLTSGTASDGTGMTAGQDVAEVHTSTSTIPFPANSILDGNVTVYCVIKQTNDAKYKTPVNITVAATSLTDNISTSTPTISTPAAMGNVAGIRTAEGTGAGALTVTYTGKKAEVADIASFTVVYPQTDLIPGTYEGYITMTYTTTV